MSLGAFLGNPIVQAILAFSGLLGTFLTILSIVQRKRQKELSYQSESSILVKGTTSTLKGLSIQYDDEAITDLTSTIVYVWNSGFDVIYDYEIVSDCPVTISSQQNNKILDVKIIGSTEKTNHFAITECTKESVSFAFEYLNPKDGITIHVLHTGDANDLSLTGKIKGGRPFVNRSEEKEKSLFETLKEEIFGVINLALFVIPYIVSAVIARAIGSPFIVDSKVTVLGALFVAVFGCLLWLPLVLSYIKLLQNRRVAVPKKLKNQK